MAAKSTTTTDTTTDTGTTFALPDPTAFEAYAQALRAGCTDTFDVWYAGDGGQAAISALADQQAAAARSERMAQAKAVWRDFKANGQITTYSAVQARALFGYLSALDMAALPEPDNAPDTTADADTTETESN